MARTHGDRNIWQQQLDAITWGRQQSCTLVNLASTIFTLIPSSSCPFPSVRTIPRRLQQTGLHGCRLVIKPFINAKNRADYVAWAWAHLGWTRAEKSRVLLSDENKYNLFESDDVWSTWGVPSVRDTIQSTKPPPWSMCVDHGIGQLIDPWNGPTVYRPGNHGPPTVRIYLRQGHTTLCPRLHQSGVNLPAR